MADFDTTHLLKLLRGHTQMPAVPGFDDAACLRALTAKLHGYILPLVKAEWQEHWLASESTTLVVPLVDGQREYVLSSRAVGASIRKAVLVGPNGARRPLRLFEVDRVEEWRDDARAAFPEGYVVRTGRVHLYPAPQGVAGWSLRMPALIRPAQLCLVSACARVTEIQDFSTTSGVYTLSAAIFGDGVTTSDTPTVDAVRASPPFEQLCLGGVGTLSDEGLTLTIPAAGLPPEGLCVGDYVCPEGLAPFAQCPVELYELLASRTATEMLASGGDADIAGAKAASLQEQRHDAVTLATPRTGEARLQGNGMRKWGGFGRSW